MEASEAFGRPNASRLSAGSQCIRVRSHREYRMIYKTSISSPLILFHDHFILRCSIRFGFLYAYHARHSLVGFPEARSRTTVSLGSRAPTWCRRGARDQRAAVSVRVDRRSWAFDPGRWYGIGLAVFIVNNEQ